MFRQWALAKKLCHFMLIYEPNNNEAKQYAPLIDYMLAKEQASSSSSSDDDSTGKSTKNYIQYVLIIYLDDENDSRSSSSASSSNEEEKPNGHADAQAPEPVNASFSHKCTHHK
jgi:hypothetical protein